MEPIDVLEFFDFLLHKDAEAFHADEASKQQTWNSIDREFTEKENGRTKRLLEKTIVTKQFKKERKEAMKQTKKLLALCLCSTVAATNFSPITIEAKTLAKAAVAPCILSDATTATLSIVQPQSVQALAVSNDGFIYEVNEESATTITITGYEGNASELVIPEKLDGYTVTKIGENAFKENENLKKVTLASTITAIEDNAFWYCKNLSSVELPSNLTTIGLVSFGNCTALTEIFIPKSLTTYTGSVLGPFEGCTNLKTATIEEGTTEVCKNLFYGSGIKEVSIPDTVTTINDDAFRFCENLSSVDLPSNLTKIGLTSFGGCTALTQIIIPKSLTTYAGSVLGPFEGCTNLKNATIEKGTTEVCKNLFYGSGLKEVSIPDTVTTINDEAFRFCENLSSVDLPSNLTKIGLTSFGGCTALTEIKIPKSLTTYTGSVLGPFEGCTNLKTATIEEGATQVCENLFYGSGIESINIPSTVTSVNEYAFYDCTKLKNIYFLGNAPKIANNIFYNVTATAYCPVNNSTWIDGVKQNYGGNITWITGTSAVTPTATPKPTATVVPITKTTVTKVTTSVSKKKKVVLSWKKKAGVTGYQIYKKTGNGKYKLVKTIKKAGTVKWTDKAVKIGKTYRYKIRAYKTVKKKKTYSKFSSVKKVIVK